MLHGRNLAPAAPIVDSGDVARRSARFGRRWNRMWKSHMRCNELTLADESLASLRWTLKRLVMKTVDAARGAAGRRPGVRLGPQWDMTDWCCGCMVSAARQLRDYNATKRSGGGRGTVAGQHRIGGDNRYHLCVQLSSESITTSHQLNDFPTRRLVPIVYDIIQVISCDRCTWTRRKYRQLMQLYLPI